MVGGETATPDLSVGDAIELSRFSTTENDDGDGYWKENIAGPPRDGRMIGGCSSAEPRSFRES